MLIILLRVSLFSEMHINNRSFMQYCHKPLLMFFFSFLYIITRVKTVGSTSTAQTVSIAEATVSNQNGSL